MELESTVKKIYLYAESGEFCNLENGLDCLFYHTDDYELFDDVKSTAYGIMLDEGVKNATLRIIRRGKIDENKALHDAAYQLAANTMFRIEDYKKDETLDLICNY